MRVKGVYEKPSGSIYVSYRDETGRQYTKTFGKGGGAQKAAEAYSLRLEADRKEGKRPHAPVREIYFDDLAQRYVDDRRDNGASESYISELKGLLNNHIVKLISDKPVDKLCYDDIKRVADYYKNRSHSTRNRYFGYLRAIFRFGIRNEITSNNPLKAWVRKREEPRPFNLTEEDLKKICENAPPHLQWAIDVEWNLGTRPGPSELLALKWADVHFDSNVVSVCATKTRKRREIPFGEDFKLRLLAKRKEAKSDYVIEYKGKPVKKLVRSFRTACRNAGLSHRYEMYDVRHLVATTLLNRGGDLASVSAILGNSIKICAEVYCHAQSEAKRRTIECLPAIFGQGQM
jgi:integrase